MGALRFFYRTTLGLKEVSENIPYARRADPLPAVLARDEVALFEGSTQSEDADGLHHDLCRRSTCLRGGGSPTGYR